ncbi:unnamed protein product [Ceratitis capitata]|uniref:(Mediterranean fruit fly) hypothetical protein n=1 Tax=Ceratitis capitata TaxID=7213 RepID=A0A811U361_CERCA|nr:unnamed protein product [Ceratitis capitata]
MAQRNIRNLLLLLAVLLRLKTVQTTLLAENVMEREREFYDIFLVKINAEERFDNCLLYGETSTSETLEILLKTVTQSLDKPILLQNNACSEYRVIDMFNSNMLILVRLENLEYDLSSLAETLHYIRHKRIILVGGTPKSLRDHEEYLTRLFRLCAAQKMLNVVAIFEDFWRTRIFYSYTIFPTFEIERKSFDAVGGVVVFPRRMNDLHGYGIRTITDQMFPFSFAYEQVGEVKVTGYLPGLLETFASSINATLHYPKPMTLDDYYRPAELINMTSNNEMDIPASRMFVQVTKTFDHASKPYAISGVCIMTPVQWYYTFRQFCSLYTDGAYGFILFSCVWLTYCLFYYCRRLQYFRAYRVFLVNFWTAWIEPNHFAFNIGAGLPYTLPTLATLRILIFLTLIWALCVETDYAASLNTFITKPAVMPVPRNWAELSKSNYKILFGWSFYNYISQWCGESCRDIEKSAEIVETAQEFRSQLHNLNTNYGYPVDLFSWHFVQLQMKLLVKPIFHLTNICLRRQIFHCFPLHPNSVFREPLNLFLTKFLAYGFHEFWIDATYLEAKRYGRIHDVSPVNRGEQGPLDMEYMSFMWPLFGAAWTLSFGIFACELGMAS